MALLKYQPHIYKEQEDVQISVQEQSNDGDQMDCLVYIPAIWEMHRCVLETYCKVRDLLKTGVDLKNEF